MRRVALVVLGVLAFAPPAHASCGATASAVRGASPLAVTFTATCDAATYAWSFGDDGQEVGRSVTHVFAAGAWRPTLTTEAGVETTPAITAISVTLSAPRVARYAAWVTVRADVRPRIPVTLRGHRFSHGKLRVRMLGTAPLIADALGVKSPRVSILLAPTLTVRLVGRALVGSPVRVVATLHPATAGSVEAPALVDTRTVHVAHIRATSRPARGWVAAAADLAVPVVAPQLALGATGPSVRVLEDRLAGLHYAIRRDGAFGAEDLEAVYAFQKVEGLDRTGTVTAELWARLLHAQTPRPRYSGPDHVEIDKTRQVIFLVRGGAVSLIVATSTGATGNTPVGTFHVYRKVSGYDWVLYYPSYFLRGFAVHGYPDVPPYPASHGCARIPMWIAQTVYAQIGYGSEVIVYT